MSIKKVEQFIESREVAEMVEKAHNDLLKDIRRYCEQLGQGKISQSDFFIESTYQNSQNKIMPCYQVTKKGCEFIAHKLTGTKGTIFTARYINRFHEMQDMLSEQAKELPWFIRKFNGEYIILERDFISITGIDVRKQKGFYREEYFVGGRDVNGHGWERDNEEFKKKYGFDFGPDPCMMYLYPSGVRKALNLLENNRKVKINPGAKEQFLEGLALIRASEPKRTAVAAPVNRVLDKPVQITITVCQNGIGAVKY